MESPIEAIGGFLEQAGEVFLAFRRGPLLPAVGAQLRTRQAIRLTGRDLRPAHFAHGFVVDLPTGTVVRVEYMTGLQGEGLSVRPIERELVRLVPHACREFAAAYGYVLEVPPGMVKTHFAVSRDP